MQLVYASATERRERVLSLFLTVVGERALLFPFIKYKLYTGSHLAIFSFPFSIGYSRVPPAGTLEYSSSTILRFERVYPYADNGSMPSEDFPQRFTDSLSLVYVTCARAHSADTYVLTQTHTRACTEENMPCSFFQNFTRTRE